MDLSTAMRPTSAFGVPAKFKMSLPRPFRYPLAFREQPNFFHIESFEKNKNGEDYELGSALALNAIFVHIPKAAGVSVSKSLFGSLGGGHFPLSAYLWLYGARKVGKMFKFTFVRNPESRLLSAYNFLKSGGMNENDRAWAAKYVMPFDTIDAFVRNSLVRPEVFNAVHFRPQVDFLRDPRTGKLGVDFVGRFETIEADFKAICKRLGIERDLPHENKTRSVDRSVLSMSSAATIRRIYEADFDALGY